MIVNNGDLGVLVFSFCLPPLKCQHNSVPRGQCQDILRISIGSSLQAYCFEVLNAWTGLSFQGSPEMVSQRALLLMKKLTAFRALQDLHLGNHKSVK